MSESRSKKALYNISASLLLEFVSIICGFILPRFILSTFGSNYNGITTSITQFLSYITLLRAGVGGVTRAALYKPLVENNIKSVSEIIKATENFMRKVAYVFLGALLLFAIIYPCLVREEFEWFFSFSLIIIMGIATFAQYYFGITYQMLIGADQRQYVNAIIQTISVILNLIVSITLMKLGFGIHMVKLGSAIVFTINPIVLYIYVRKRYSIIKNVEPNNYAIKQRWDAFMHQIAAFVQENTDVVVLTIFSTLKEISVYSIYFLISNGIKKLLETITTGLEAAFGNMIALNDYETLKRSILELEVILYSVATISYACVLNLILPFVSIYTKGINDVNYIRPIFATILVFAQFFYCIRTPYQYVVEASGHFKQTKNGAICEAIINIVVSVVFVIKFGLVGVAIGTLISIIFRTIQYVIYTSKNILNRSVYFFIKRLIISITDIVIITFLIQSNCDLTANTYSVWIIKAFFVGIISFFIVISSNFLFDYKITRDSILRIKKILKRNTK